MSKRLPPRKKDRNQYVHQNPRRLPTFMSAEEAAQKPHIKSGDYTELEITGNVCNLHPHIWTKTNLTCLYLNNNSLTSIPGEVALLVNLAHLNLACNKLRTLPPEIGEMQSLRELLLSHNNIVSLPTQLGKLFKLTKLELIGNPLGGRIMEIINRPSCRIEDILSYLMEHLPVTSTHPPPRPWIVMNQQEPTSSCSFTVMCYNILCDKYATRQMYGYCPNWALDWSYRKKHILQELLHYKADIISLQEVETEQFYRYFKPELRKEGYDGIFSPKSRAKTMAESERKHVDGCAIFFKTDKFTLVKDHLMEFNQLAMANAEGSDDMLNRVMPKDNIGLAALLQTKPGAYRDDTNLSQLLLVCTAHIHWDPEYSDVKIIQTMMLMHELKTFVDNILQTSNVPVPQRSEANVIPLLLCGDFNSLPDSGVIEYLSSGRVSVSHCDFKEFVYKDCLSKLGNASKTNEFTHPFKISRAYNNDEIMPFTNYSYDFKGIIDYIFFSKLHMSVLGVLGAIDCNWLDENRIHGCPHPHVPSDHFPIVVELQLNPTLPIQLSSITPNGLVLHR